MDLFGSAADLLEEVELLEEAEPVVVPARAALSAGAGLTDCHPLLESGTGAGFLCSITDFGVVVGTLNALVSIGSLLF